MTAVVSFDFDQFILALDQLYVPDQTALALQILDDLLVTSGFLSGTDLIECEELLDNMVKRYAEHEQLGDVKAQLVALVIPKFQAT